MKKNVLFRLLATVMILSSARTAISQENNGFKVKASAELVSSYVWRGVPCYSYHDGDAILPPNFQPTLAFTKGGFEIGAWGSSDFTGSYQEADLYALYNYKNLTATITDYYWDPEWASKSYFSYKNATTGHVIEGTLAYLGSNVPLSITLATMFYGADKKNDDPVVNNYSTYFELGYSFKANDYSFDTFLGMTPADGFYGDGYGNVTGFGIVNVGVTAYKKIQISEKYETTLRSTLAFNPQQEKAYVVFGITF
ncbi:MAG: hypothetical protein WCR72_06630 [Bacteroidota bacterium]